MTDPVGLEALLQRAVELEVKAAAAEAAVRGEELTLDAAQDLAAQAHERLDGEMDSAVIAELEERLEAINDQLDALPSEPAAAAEAAWEDFGDDLDGDNPSGMDFDEPDDLAITPPGEEEKALGGCPSCGSRDVDELVGGVVQCGACGWDLKGAPPVETKSLDDELADVEPDPQWLGEVKSVGLSELEVLQRRRLALED